MCLMLSACPPERACACASNYVLFECTAAPLLSLATGSSKMGGTVSIDTIAPVTGELLVQGGGSVRGASLNVTVSFS